MGRLGSFSEAAWKRVLAFVRRLEESLALFGGVLTPRVDWRTILRRLVISLGGILWCLEGVQEASWRRLGGVSELPCRFVVGLGHGIAFIVDFQICCGSWTWYSIHCRFSEGFSVV